MLPAYALVRFSDVQLEDRAKPPSDDIQTLFSVQSTHICLCKRFQGSFLYPCVGVGGVGINYTLKTSAL